jgi:uncharacterized protein (TIGR02594 family)
VLGAEVTALAPPWLIQARKYLGLHEIPGPKHANAILRWLELLGSKVRDDETAWCATFVGGMLELEHFTSTKSLAARSYEDWGVELDYPAVGAIVVFSRPPRPYNGHVAFIEGEDADGRLMCIGGNQGDQVSVAPFSRDRVVSYRWPKDYPPPGPRPLPLVASNAPTSSDEA